MPPGMIWEILIGSFGTAGAILLIGGAIYLRLQRDRQQFQLLQTALEKGITAMPGTIPGWMLSLRQGVLALLLGLGIASTGIALHATASSIAEPPAAAFQRPADLDDRPPPPPRVDGRPQRDDRPPPRPPQNPAMDRWHRVESQKLIGLVALCSGAILAALGLVRIAFSRLERRYTESTAAPPPSV
ncbi:MAG: hypothetical protein ACTHN5_15480 [Phycisphaerae bacterium]